jgi:hypothetical protein
LSARDTSRDGSFVFAVRVNRNLLPAIMSGAPAAPRASKLLPGP